MSNWRISVLEKDNTNKVEASGAIIGATAINAPKGPSEFTRFEKGSVQAILDTFGYPSVTYPGIQDALDFIQTAPLFLASPAGDGAKYGGVFVTSAGTIPFISGTATKSIANYAAVSCTHVIGITDGLTASYLNKVLPQYARYNGGSLTTIKLGATTIAVTNSGATPTEVLTGTGLTTGSQYSTADGKLSIVFNSIPDAGKEISATYTIDLSSIIYCTLFSKYAQADDLKVKITENTDNPKTFTMQVARLDPLQTGSVYVELLDSPFYFGVNPTDKDAYGESIYVEDIFGDNQYYFTATVQNSLGSSDTITGDADYVALAGGYRGAATDGADVAGLYTQLTDLNKYPVSLVFDTTGSSEVVTAFSGLRAGLLKYVTFAYPTPNVSAATIIATPATYRPTSNRGCICYALTWGVHTDQFQGHHFLCSNMGLVAERIATSMLLDPSAQPSYVNENNCGGQLKAGIRKLSQSLTDTEAQALEVAKINPVTNDPFYGAMIVGWRTTNGVNNVYSYIAQSIQADMIIKQIIRDALAPQQGKANDDLHRTTVANIANGVLASFSKGLDAYFVKCDKGNNTDAIMNQEKFVLSVAVRFVSYAKLITFNFVTTRFGTSVEEAIN